MAVKLSPLFNDAQLDNNGLPLAGGLVYWYLAGTTTPVNTYTDVTGATPQTNPVALNSRGEPFNPIWLTTGAAYKATLKDSLGSTIRTIDNIPGIDDVTALAISEWALMAAAASYISSSSFSVVGDQTAILTVNRRVKATVTGGTYYGTVLTASYGAGITTITTANDSIGFDSGLAAISYSILAADHPSVPNLYIPITSLTSLEAQTTRQTVLAGPTDSSGLPSFLPATSASLSLTSQNISTGTAALVVSAANGFTAFGNFNRIGMAIANLTWSALPASNTSYLYVDVAADGTLTAGSSLLAPVYQWGGTRSTVNGQFTYNIQEHYATVGNGTTAPQAYRVFVGECVAGAATITSTVAYAYQGRYDSGFIATLPGVGTLTTKVSNLGLTASVSGLSLKCLTAEYGYSIGDIIAGGFASQNGGGVVLPPAPILSNNSIAFVVGGTAAWYITRKDTFANAAPTAANWAYRLVASRGW